jgi:hypothetical protein
VDVTTTEDLRNGIGSTGVSTLILMPGATYALGGSYLTIPVGATVVIATRGDGPRAIIDGQRLSRLFRVDGTLRLIRVELVRGLRTRSDGSAGGGAIFAYGAAASVHVTGCVISDCAATSSGGEVSSAHPPPRRLAPHA